MFQTTNQIMYYRILPWPFFGSKRSRALRFHPRQRKRAWLEDHLARRQGPEVQHVAWSSWDDHRKKASGMEISCDFLGISWDLLGFHGILWDFVGFIGISWDFLGFRGIYWDFMGSSGISWDLLGFHGILWDFVGFIGISWDLLGFRGIYWDFMGFLGVYQDYPGDQKGDHWMGIYDGNGWTPSNESWQWKSHPQKRGCSQLETCIWWVFHWWSLLISNGFLMDLRRFLHLILRSI